jgi:hypothetical protein
MLPYTCIALKVRSSIMASLIRNGCVGTHWDKTCLPFKQGHACARKKCTWFLIQTMPWRCNGMMYARIAHVLHLMVHLISWDHATFKRLYPTQLMHNIGHSNYTSQTHDGTSITCAKAGISQKVAPMVSSTVTQRVDSLISAFGAPAPT